jgi:hypothetical protein
MAIFNFITGILRLSLNLEIASPQNVFIFRVIMVLLICIFCRITSENVAEKYGITREEQDKFSLASQQK